MKKKITALVLVVAVLAMLFTGMTLAYFTDTDDAVNVFTVGDVDIELTEDAVVIGPDGNEDPDRLVENNEGGYTYSNILAGTEMKKEVTITNLENPAYVRVTVIVNNYKLIDAIGTYYEKKGYTEEQIQKVFDDVFNGWHVEYSHYPNGQQKDMRMAIPNAELAEIDDNLLKVDSTFTTIQGAFHFGLANWFKTEHEAEYAAAGKYDAGHDVGYNGGYYAQHLNDYELCYTYYLKMGEGESATLFNGLTCPTYFNQELARMFNGLEIEVYAAAIQQEGFDSEIAAFLQLDSEYPVKDMRG